MTGMLDNIESKPVQDSISVCYNHLNSFDESIRKRAKLTFISLIGFGQRRLPEITSECDNQIRNRLLKTGISHFGPMFFQKDSLASSRSDLIKVLRIHGFLVEGLNEMNTAQLQIFVIHLRSKGLVSSESFSKYLSY